MSANDRYRLTVTEGDDLAQAVRQSDKISEDGIAPVLEYLTELQALNLSDVTGARPAIEFAECLLLAMCGNVAASEVVESLMAVDGVGLGPESTRFMAFDNKQGSGS